MAFFTIILPFGVHGSGLGHVQCQRFRNPQYHLISHLDIFQSFHGIAKLKTNASDTLLIISITFLPSFSSDLKFSKNPFCFPEKKFGRKAETF